MISVQSYTAKLLRFVFIAIAFLAANPAIAKSLDKAFYAAVTQHPPKSDLDAIFNDQNNIIWVDWGQDSESIASAFGTAVNAPGLTAEYLDANNQWGYNVQISYAGQLRAVTPKGDTHEVQLTLSAISELLSPEFQIRYVSDTTGNDTMGFVVERTQDWDVLYQQYGRRLNEHFCPIDELPDLFSTPMDKLDAAIKAYVDQAQ